MTISVPTILQMNKYHQLHERYHQTQQRFYALQSQGKHCPPEILSQASREMYRAHREYKEFKDSLWPTGGKPLPGLWPFWIKFGAVAAVWCLLVYNWR